MIRRGLAIVKAAAALRTNDEGPARRSNSRRRPKESEGRLAGRPSLRLNQPSVQVGVFDWPFVLPAVPKLPVQVNSVWFPWVIVKL
jgi:hypothetical protein